MTTTTAAEYAELYGDINEHRNEPTGEEAPTMQTTTTNEIKFDIIANLIHRYDRATNGYYFSKDTMKFFSGKVYEPVYRVGEVEIFVDSIRDTWGDQPRQYRVCEWDGTSSTIDTVTEYKTLRSAEKAARRHAEHLANQ